MPQKLADDLDLPREYFDLGRTVANQTTADLGNKIAEITGPLPPHQLPIMLKQRSDSKVYESIPGHGMYGSVATRVGEGSEPCGPWCPPRELIYLTPNRLSL